MRLRLRTPSPSHRSRHGPYPRTAAELKVGEEATLDRIDLPDDVAQRLMELGFLPGHQILAAFRAPGGDPRVYRVDGSEIALRRETAAHLTLRAPALAPVEPRS